MVTSNPRGLTHCQKEVEPMALDIAEQIAAMTRMTVTQMRTRYIEGFGEPARSSNRQPLIRRIAGRLQALEHGTLSQRARRKAAELADEANLRLTAPKDAPLAAAPPRPVNSGQYRDRRLPPPGNVIAGTYKGQSLRVNVLEDGFEYEGLRYRSLSAVAKAITGSHLNGYAFFGLAQRRRANEKNES